jgi:hypothetical protein
MENFTFNYFEKRVKFIEDILIEIQKEIQAMAISQTQFDTDLATLGTDLTALLALVNQLIAKQGGTPVDLTTEDTGVNSMDASVKTAITAATAALGTTPA